MAVKLWWIWMILAALFITGEIFTAGFFLLWFGIGALAAGILAVLGLGAGWQWGAFFAVSFLLLAVSRRFAERFSRKQPPGIGADRFIGKSAVVLEEINNLKNTGRVRLDKEDWRADSASEDIISVDRIVKVIGLDGTHLVVEPIEKED